MCLSCVPSVYSFAPLAKMNLSFTYVIFIPVYACSFRLVLLFGSVILYFTAELCSRG